MIMHDVNRKMCQTIKKPVMEFYYQNISGIQIVFFETKKKISVRSSKTVNSAKFIYEKKKFFSHNFFMHLCSDYVNINNY